MKKGHMEVEVTLTPEQVRLIKEQLVEQKTVEAEIRNLYGKPFEQLVPPPGYVFAMAPVFRLAQDSEYYLGSQGKVVFGGPGVRARLILLRLEEQP